MMQTTERLDTLIRSRPEPYCYLCGEEGRVQYADLPDRLFHTPGTWTIKACPRCNLLWLDPIPNEADIGKAYENYYTHPNYPVAAAATLAGSELPLPLRRIIRRAMRSMLLPLLDLISVDKRARDSMYLRSHRPGRLLDVGCGRGLWLRRFHDQGWEVVGQDLDPEAAREVRRDLGIPVHIGPLETAPYAHASFDAVIMSHVVEHVHDPIGLLRTCKGFLKTGGLLIALTPNTASSIHQHFGADWLGLDPPRHLRLFTRSTLQRVAEKAGFRKVRTWTTPARAGFGALESRKLQVARAGATGREYQFSPYGTEPPWAWALWVFWQQYCASVRAALDPDAGDECVLRAVK